MAKRTDLLHSYQFRTRRVLAALVMRETDPGQSPLRRGVGAVFAGVMLTVLASAGFGIYGVLARVGGDDWRQPGSVVVERETGASYVYFDGTLYPTLNLASAMLAGGQPNPSVHRVAAQSLSDVARGNPIGILGAPDSLPPADRQIGLPWTVCALAGTDGAGGRIATVALAAGVSATGGAALTEEGLLVRDASLGRTYLIWHGHRFRIDSPGAVVPALFGAAPPVDVGTAWLNALPAGLDIAPAEIPDRGGRSSAAPEYHNGDVLVLQALAGTQYYLVLDDGIAALSDLQFAVLDAQVEPVKQIHVEASTVAGIQRPEARETDPPATAPPLVAPAGSDVICATITADWQPSIAVGAAVAGLDRATPTAGVSPDGVPLANRVLVPAGSVCVLREVAAAGSPTGSFVVVTDIGIAFPVPDAGVLPLLGYSSAQAVDIPASLAQLIPAGPTLDPAAAIELAPGSADQRALSAVGGSGR